MPTDAAPTSPPTGLPSRAAPDATPAAAGRSTPPLLVAADGREDVRPAMRVAAAIAARLDVPVRVLAALDPMPAGGAAVGSRRTERARTAVVREAMRRRIRESTRQGGAWTVEAVLGSPTRTIAEAAAQRRAEIVLLGARWQDRATRLSGTERALEVARAGVTPVLVAGPEADGEFRRAVVGVDFGAASARAAAVACRLLSPGATLSLVHVEQRPALGPPIAERLRLLATTVGGRDDVEIGTTTLVGDPSRELAAYADRVGADLVACGTRAGGRVEGRYAPSVSAGIARRVSAGRAGCSVLVCPVPPGGELAAPERGPGIAAEALDPAEWRLALDGFWRRNTGRLATVVVDEPASGAPRVASGVALVAAAYDPAAGRAELRFADAAGGPAHPLSRDVPDVRAVTVLSGPDERDVALRVEHGRGLIAVSFLPVGAAGPIG